MTKNYSSRIKKLFPLNYKLHWFSKYSRKAEQVLADHIKNTGLGRVPGKFTPKKYSVLERKYGRLPRKGEPATKVVSSIVRNFMGGAPLWRSPNLQHNVGAAVNVVASAVYALALDVNIYNINSDLAGNALAAERAVARILADLANIDKEKSHGIFTFGGTATNLYALKTAINKIHPHAAFNGIPKNIKFLITEDAHFSHGVAANWLGLGTENLIVIPANEDRRSNLKRAEIIAKRTLEKGETLVGMNINGGTTYDHAVDDIAGFVNLRKKLINDYRLDYTPHIHVDSVIGWAWLMFNGYDFKQNPLKFNKEVLVKIKAQYLRIARINLADSWGVDFHKGVGGCPIPCSVIMMNNRYDFMFLSKRADPLTTTHQLAQEFSFESPSDYTLETSRPGGAPLAALAALHSLGKEGYQAYLGKLVWLVHLFRGSIQKLPDAIVANPHSLGYVSMIIIFPPEINITGTSRQKFLYLKNVASRKLVNQINNYMKAFFQWDSETRMTQTLGTVYSYSSSYIKAACGVKLSALKFYPVSPHLSESHIKKAVKILKEQKEIFDANIWANRKDVSQ